VNEQIIWGSILDDRYAIQVVRVALYHGKLVIREADEEIFSQQVALSYGATFGPDVSEIADWQEIVLGFIEDQKRQPTRARRPCVCAHTSGETFDETHRQLQESFRSKGTCMDNWLPTDRVSRQRDDSYGLAGERPPK
jgi:hypothetical protein